ncbi:MAG TPA: SH3 domain-containing protein [Anaerolineales bacterium]|nr:SH3 domain-containing protein [Anaerolineales bacterium]
MAKLKVIGVVVLILVWMVLSQVSAHIVQANRMPQIPTVDIPTVTGTPLGPTVTARRDTDQEQINVRAGPSTNYETVGVMIAGQQAPALGRTRGGDWVQILFPGAPNGTGWVYAPLVDLSGEVPIVEPPPTPTPQTTPTIDPTLAAQFIVELPPTRLPTFTPPPPLVIPTFQVEEINTGTGGVPMGFVIIGLGVVGLFGTLISLLRGR